MRGCDNGFIDFSARRRGSIAAGCALAEHGPMKRALLVLGLLASPLVHAGPEITQAQRDAANDAFQRANWPAAAKAYAPIVAVEDHPALHGRYGTALVEIDRPRDAVPHL